MFLHKLEKDEKTEFLSLARHLAHVDDNNIDEREEYMLRYMCAEMGLSYDPAEVEAYDPDRVARVFFREKARRILLLEAVGVCYSNGAMDAAQRETLEGLSARFSLDAGLISRAEDLVKRQLSIMDEFEAIVEKA